jgi:hypothetical protein
VAAFHALSFSNSFFQAEPISPNSELAPGTGKWESDWEKKG